MKHLRYCKELETIRGKGLHRTLRHLDSPPCARSVVDGRDVLLFSSNSYLGLADHPDLVHAGQSALEQYGTTAGASRLLAGGCTLHRALEQELARLKGTADGLLFGTGYMANVGVLTALLDKDSVVYCDRLNHASIIDGCRLSGADLVVYHHADPDDLRKKVERYAPKHGLLITDGVFSMDGDVAPLKELLTVARERDILTVVDDAHGTGVLGTEGAGTAAMLGVSDLVDIHVGTLSKAYAGMGGFAAGSTVMVDYLRNVGRPFIYSTALPPHAVAISLAALRVASQESWRQQTLAQRSGAMRARLQAGGLEVPMDPTPIIPVLLGSAETTVAVSTALLEQGIYVPAIRPPTVKVGTSRLRISMMATHTAEDVDQTAVAILRAAERAGVLK